MKAWLITWEWMGNAAAVADRIAGILNGRWADKRVRDAVEFLYARCTSNAAELAEYARVTKHNPYPAKRDFNGGFTCGHDPWLHARIVEDFKVREDRDGLEIISWTELPMYRPTDAGPELVRGRYRREAHRQVKGTLSDELIWDRMKGGFKSGLEAAPKILRLDKA